MGESSSSKTWAKGYLRLLGTAIPLILGTGYLAILEFIDRVMLSWYSKDAVAAVTPASVSSLALISFFMGISVYVGTFVAQYLGAGLKGKIGPFFWHGVYLSVLGGVLVLPFALLSPSIFAVIGHAPQIQALEAEYFHIICLGAVFPIMNAFLMSFFSSIGRLGVVVVSILAAVVVNITLGYALIFGKLGAPEMGVAGSAISTVCASTVSLAIYAVYLLLGTVKKEYDLARSARLDLRLLAFILRYGVPNGIQFFLDVIGFTVFLLIVGRIGVNELAASNIVLNINNIAFMPMFGIGMAISILVAERIGARDHAGVKMIVSQGLVIGLAYVGTIAAIYFFGPGVLIQPFTLGHGVIQDPSVLDHTKSILALVALYSLFDAVGIVVSNAIKGAGDTRFVMVTNLIGTVFVLIIPTFILVEVFEVGVFSAWVVFTATVIVMCAVFCLRYLSGRWKTVTLVNRLV